MNFIDFRLNNNIDSLLFDMDGVLVDVSKSYREAIKQTAAYFLQRDVSTSEVDVIKNRVGMNNDWDATYALIGRDTLDYGEVKNHFQKLYLGTENKGGFIDKEPLLVSKAKLQLLKNRYGKLGIATGRPRFEAMYTLQRNGLMDIFDEIIAMEDVKNGKPAPDMILLLMKKLQVKNTVYIGDSPSDVVASEKADIPCLYVGKQAIGTKRFDKVSGVINFLLS